MYTQYTSTSHQCRIFLSGKRSDWISHQSFSSTFTESSKNAREAARQQRRKTPSTKKEGGGEIVMKTVSWTWNFLNVTEVLLSVLPLNYAVKQPCKNEQFTEEFFGSYS